MKISNSVGGVLRWGDSSAGASKADQCDFGWGVWEDGLRVRLLVGFGSGRALRGKANRQSREKAVSAYATIT
jgi:hypothetical protein